MVPSSYLMVLSSDHAEKEYIEMEGVMGDIWISGKPKGNVLTSYIIPAVWLRNNGTNRETREGAESNWIRRIV